MLPKIEDRVEGISLFVYSTWTLACVVTAGCPVLLLCCHGGVPSAPVRILWWEYPSYLSGKSAPAHLLYVIKYDHAPPAHDWQQRTTLVKMTPPICSLLQCQRLY